MAVLPAIYKGFNTKQAQGTYYICKGQRTVTSRYVTPSSARRSCATKGLTSDSNQGDRRRTREREEMCDVARLKTFKLKEFKD